jgi:uncharacterized protein (DUF1778 family)
MGIRIRTDGDKAYREDLVDRLADDLDENRTDAIIDAAMHTRNDIAAKRELAAWLGDEIEGSRLSVEQVREIVEILSGPDLIVEPEVDVTIESGVGWDVSVQGAEPEN